MKKVLRVLLLTVLLIPVVVRADMGAPEVLNYTAIVIKDGGVDYYSEVFNGAKKEGHLNKDEKVEVQFEATANGVTYLYACKSDGSCFYVDSNDLLPVDKEVSPDHEGVYKYPNPVEYVINADEVEVRKGPSISYDSVGNLVKGYKGKTSYIASSHYIYVETDKIKGWVEMLGETVFVKNSTKLIAIKDLETKCGTIPANTILDDVWDATAWDGTSLIKYNGCEYVVTTFRSNELYHFSESYEDTAYEDGKIYETGELKKALTSIPKDAKMQVIAESGEVGQRDVIYVEYNGVKGYYASNSYVEGNPTPQTDPEPTPTPEPDPEPTTGPTTDPTEDVAPKEDTKDDSKKSKGMDTLTIVIICCVSAVAVALAAVATIVLVNKKKKNKTSPEETKPVESTIEAAPAEGEQVESATEETPVEEKQPEENKVEDKKEEL